MKRIFAVLAAVVLISFLPPSAGAQPKTKAPASYAPSDLISITVDRGDYLIAICKRYLDGEKRWPEIARINRMGNAHRVQPGAKLNVPIAYLKGVPVNGRVTFVQGDAKARPGGQGGWVSLKAGDTVSPKSALKTGPESALEITFEDGSSFLLRSNTEMGIVSAQKVLSSRLVRDLYLGAGRVLTNVKEATGEAPRFKIRTPSAIASVRGTEFRVAVEESQKTYAEVLKNVVTVEATRGSVDLAQGEGTMVEKGGAPLAPRKLLPPPVPENLVPIFNTAPSIRFSAVEGARATRAAVTADAEGRKILREKIVKRGDTFRLPGLPDGSYYLMAQSIDEIGLEGPPSSVLPFKIRVNPEPPITQQPRNRAKLKGTSVSFRWLAVGDAVSYHVQIARDGEFANVVLDKQGVRESTFAAEDLAYGAYFLRVASVASDGYQGAWSDPLAVTLSALPPTPSVEEPAISKDEIHLKTKNLGEGFAYRFQIAREAQFKKILIDSKTEKPELTIKRPAEAGKYYVRTAALDRDGDAGSFSAPQAFEVEKGFPYGWVGGSVGAVIIILLLIFAN